MSLKTWLIGLGLFGITNGAAAQSDNASTNDKKIDQQTETTNISPVTGANIDTDVKVHSSKFEFTPSVDLEERKISLSAKIKPVKDKPTISQKKLRKTFNVKKRSDIKIRSDQRQDY